MQLCDSVHSTVPLDSMLSVALRCLQPYLHKSRHEHANKRVRGPHGRFLTAAELAAQQQAEEGNAAQQHDASSLTPDSALAEAQSKQ